MKTFKLNDFSDDGVLNEIETAEFLAKKLGADNRLDFSDISSISREFVDALLEGQTLEGLDGRILGLSDLISHALEEWVVRQQKPAVTISKPKKKLLVPKLCKAEPMEYERAEPEGERFTPTRLVKRLRRQLTGYIESAYPLSDPILVRARRSILDQAKDGHLLAQEPYVESTPKYLGFKGSYKDLGLSDHIASFFPSYLRRLRNMQTSRVLDLFCTPVCMIIKLMHSENILKTAWTSSLQPAPDQVRRSVF